MNTLNWQCMRALEEFVVTHPLLLLLTKAGCENYSMLIPCTPSAQVDWLVNEIKRLWPGVAYDTRGTPSLLDALCIPGLTVINWLQLNNAQPEFGVPHPVVYKFTLLPSSA